MLEFLRDVGKHFTIPYMLAKDSVQTRLDAGLSYTEFSYMLLQAADFLHLYRELDVELQTGGADQWGNITAGLELIRRVEGAGEGAELAHALSYPLLLAANGEKFGKTAEGTSVWLDPERTSPYAFYQFWLDADDAAVGRLIRLFTLFDRATIEALEAEAAAAPERRLVQRALARDITARVHGAEVGRAGSRRSARPSSAADCPSSGRRPSRSPSSSSRTPSSGPTTWPRDRSALTVAAGLFGSNGEARRALGQGGRVDQRASDCRASTRRSRRRSPGATSILRSGKKTYRIVRIDGAADRAGR